MSSYTIPNLKNACRILQRVAAADGALSMSEIADPLGLPRSTVFRILHTLAEEGMLHREGKAYRLGGALLFLGRKAMDSSTLNTLARPILERLTQLTGETSQLASLSHGKVLIMEVSDSPHPLAAHSRPGTLADLHCSASGKALLAFSTPTDRSKVLSSLVYTPHTANSLESRAALEAELESTFQRGYAIDEEEYHEGIRCIAVPVRSGAEQASFAIGITASTTRFTKRKISKFAQHLKEAAGELEALIH